MAFIIGIDEAGYGPNLGPIVVGGTLWQVPDANEGDQMPAEFSFGLGKNDNGPDSVFDTFADSKKLYSRGSGLGRLELPILSLLQCCNDRAEDFRGPVDLFCKLTGESSETFESEPGYCWRDVPIPCGCSQTEIEELEIQMGLGLTQARTRCLSLAATMVFPQAWNEGLVREGNKASLLSGLSCRLVRRLLSIADEKDPAASESVLVFCDKHGGRNRYAALLQHEMNCDFVTVLSESRETSTYSWQDESGRSIEIAFTAKGESQAPVAVASMVAKYLRELAMAGWNSFWQQEIPELQPTAGYPLDAKRFRQDIAHTRKRLRIPDSSIWRER